jgi:hypothetical protein
MSEYQITYWQEIPSLVTAREGRRNRASVELPSRFQEAIDEAAMRLRLSGTDAYLEAWRRAPWQQRDGPPEEIARAVAAELEAEYPPERLQAIIQDLRAGT